MMQVKMNVCKLKGDCMKDYVCDIFGLKVILWGENKVKLETALSICFHASWI